MEIFRVENLSFTYPACDKKAVDNVSFSVEKGSFVSVCGPTGSGKSTLLRMLKKELVPLGERTGEVYFSGKPVSDISDGESAGFIGYVMQNPEQQIVTDKVWHELAFGLENLGVSQKVMHSRIAEMAAYFGIEDWFEKSVSSLSGGQKQLLNLAAVMVMQPQIIILDEPTAQLDPIAASDFIATLKKLNRELGLTVIIAEHRLEEVIPISDRLMVIEDGRLTHYDEPRKVIGNLRVDEKILSAMPIASRVFAVTGGIGECPLDVREGRAFIENNFRNDIVDIERQPCEHSGRTALQFSNVYFRYEKKSPDVLSGLSFSVYEGEIFTILGGNGAGKSTALSAASGLIKPYSGEIKIFGKNIGKYKNGTLYKECVAMLPQDVQTVFLKSTVEEELIGAEEAVKLLPVDIMPLYKKHPYDLSGGEQQLVALAKTLSAKPKLLLMDEPTKGLDSESKNGLVEVVKKLKSEGITVVIVTHDAEFAALCSDRCAMFFRGCIASESEPYEFFSENNFYTTAASRITRGYYNNVVTVEDVITLCLKNKRKAGGE